jgi:hypothetical protein
VLGTFGPSCCDTEATAGFIYFILYAVLGTFGPSRGETKATAGYFILFYFQCYFSNFISSAIFFISYPVLSCFISYPVLGASGSLIKISTTGVFISIQLSSHLLLTSISFINDFFLSHTGSFFPINLAILLFIHLL